MAGRGHAFGACCFAGKLRSPVPLTGRWAHLARVGGGDLYGNPYVNPYGIPCASDGVPTHPRERSSVQVRPPREEWSGRAERMRFRD